MFGLENVTFKIILGDSVVQQQNMQGINVMIIQQFVEISEQLGNDNRPMRVECIQGKNMVSFGNNAHMRAFPNLYKK